MKQFITTILALALSMTAVSASAVEVTDQNLINHFNTAVQTAEANVEQSGKLRRYIITVDQDGNVNNVDRRIHLPKTQPYYRSPITTYLRHDFVTPR